MVRVEPAGRIRAPAGSAVTYISGAPKPDSESILPVCVPLSACLTVQVNYTVSLLSVARRNLNLDAPFT